MVFRTGKSGNPGGRPRQAPEVKAAIQNNGITAIQRMTAILSDDAAFGAGAWLSGKDQILLLEKAQDRAFGRPDVLAVNHSHNHSGVIEARSAASTKPSLQAVQSKLPEKQMQDAVINGTADSVE